MKLKYLKNYTFEDLRNFCLNQKDERAILMNDTSPDSGIGDIMVQFARAYYKRRISDVGISVCFLLEGTNCQYVGSIQPEDRSRAIRFIFECRDRRVTNYAEVKKVAANY